MFGQLGRYVFAVFIDGDRVLSQRAIYDDFYQSDLLFPNETEVVGAIYQCLTCEPALWAEDEAPIDLDRLGKRAARRVHTPEEIAPTRPRAAR